MGGLCQYGNNKYGDVDLKNKNIIRPNMIINNSRKDKDDKTNNKSQNLTTVLGYSRAKSYMQKETISEYLSKNDFNKRVFELINKIRLNPSEYATTILDNIKYIIYETHLVPNEETGEEEDKRVCIFKKKVKVTLNKGESSFQEAAKVLENTPPMDKFIFKEKIILPLPNNEDELLDHKYLKKQATEIMRKNKISFYFHAYIKNPEIAVLMMIIDDNSNNIGKKRNYLLNPDLKFIGINSKFIGHKFIACFSFSK
jgi:hypothetical protein